MFLQAFWERSGILYGWNLMLEELLWCLSEAVRDWVLVSTYRAWGLSHKESLCLETCCCLSAYTRAERLSPWGTSCEDVVLLKQLTARHMEPDLPHAGSSEQKYTLSFTKHTVNTIETALYLAAHQPFHYLLLKGQLFVHHLTEGPQQTPAKTNI